MENCEYFYIKLHTKEKLSKTNIYSCIRQKPVDDLDFVIEQNLLVVILSEMIVDLQLMMMMLIKMLFVVYEYRLHLLNQSKRARLYIQASKSNQKDHVTNGK